MALLANEIDSWMTGVNMNVEGKQTRTIVRYSGTAPEYRAKCDEVGGRRVSGVVFPPGSGQIAGIVQIICQSNNRADAMKHTKTTLNGNFRPLPR